MISTLGDYGKKECITILGCTWENPDGTTQVNPELEGRCSGTPKPCKDHPSVSCTETNGCKWYSDTLPGVCGNADIYKNTQPQCTPTTVGMDIRTTGTHPETVKRTCLLQPGCIWTRADGTVIDHLD